MNATATANRAISAANALSRIQTLDWERISRELDDRGNALLGRILSANECQALAALYPDDSLFRSRVVMARHGFGRGEYKYFDYPLPEVVAEVRTAIYPRLAEIANRWNALMGLEVHYPETHSEFLKRCQGAGQLRPTPLLLQYGEGDTTVCIRTFTASMFSPYK